MDRAPEWLPSTGSQKRCDLNDPTKISFDIKRIVEQNKGRRARIVVDVLSPLLVLNPQESMHRCWSQLTTELKRYDVVLLALEEEGMHPPNVVVSMEQLLDGVIEMKLFESGLTFTPLLRIKKMIGLVPPPGYFRFSLTNQDMEIVAHVK